MGTRRPLGYPVMVLAGLALFGASSFFCFSYAQVTSATGAGNLGTSVTAGPNFDITGGTRSGANLFHGFQSFSLDLGQVANFINDSGLATSNVLARVSGGSPSNIYGTIQTTGFPGAHLFLMNPSGILFGPTAQLAVEGSFHATTADYIKLGNDGIFYADAARASVLTASPPSAFGFLAGNPASIDVMVGGLDLDTFAVKGLVVPEGETLSLVGGTLNIGTSEVRDDSGAVVQPATPGYLLAPGGRVNLVSVGPSTSAREVAFDGTGFSTAAAGPLGDINIKGGVIPVDLGDGNGPTEFLFESVVDGKDVFIHGGKLIVSDGIISPSYSSLLGLANPTFGGQVNITATDVTMTGTGFDGLTGIAPGVYVFSGNLFDVPAVEGSVPSVNITTQSLSISGFAGIQSARMGPDAPGGTPGDVTINADTVNVSSGGSIALLNGWEGAGANLTINARDVNLSGDGSPSTVGFEGLGSQGVFHPVYPFVFVNGDVDLNRAMTSGDSGSINLNLTGKLSVQGTAQIVTDSLNFGRGGDININAADIALVGAGAETGVIAAQSALTGDAGNVNIGATGTIHLQNGFRISSSTAGAGNGGSVTVTAGKSIVFDGAESRILSLTVPLDDAAQDNLFLRNWGYDYAFIAEFLTGSATADLFTVLDAMNGAGWITTTATLSPGAGGRISVNAPQLTLNTGTRIETSSGWDGNAGSIEANVGSLLLNGGALKSTSGFQRLTGEAIVGTGAAGAIDVNATDSISIYGAGSIVSTTTFGDGKGGDVTLTAGQVNVESGGKVASESGGMLGGVLNVGTGNAGTVTVNAGNALTISGDGSTVSTSTLGEGNGGDVNLTSLGDVRIENGGSVTADSLGGAGFTGKVNVTAGNSIIMDNGTISTRAVTSDGGDIKLTAPNTVQLNGSQITTSVESGVGGGGNITIDPQFVIVNNSSIIANAFGGPGGNITIIADNFLSSATSVIEASSALSTPGVIEIRSPDNNVESSIAQLPGAFVDASALLRGLCTARRTGAPSSFVVAGRGGVPVDADGYLPSLSADAAAAKVASTTSTTRLGAGRIDRPVLAVSLLLSNDLDCLR